MQPDDSLGKSSVVADPLTEGIHKDTNGPDKASDSVRISLIFRATAFVPADACTSILTLT